MPQRKTIGVDLFDEIKSAKTPCTCSGYLLGSTWPLRNSSITPTSTFHGRERDCHVGVRGGGGQLH